MGAKIKVVFFATLAVLLFQAASCSVLPRNSDEDEQVRKDLDTLLTHQEETLESIDLHLKDSFDFIESARKDIKSANSCDEVREALDEVMNFLRKDEDECSKETIAAICGNLCLLSKYDEKQKNECQVSDSHEKKRQVPLEESDSECNLSKEKDRALKKLTKARGNYEGDIKRSRWVSIKAFDTIYIGCPKTTESKSVFQKQ
ncbi:uncharacterized protein [Bemisia tabaci]|uniref:uncharacterized protein n=1 Tax=Bemisia tabaci TaxID=7038 RepID=UPI003B283B14